MADRLYFPWSGKTALFVNTEVLCTYLLFTAQAQNFNSPVPIASPNGSVLIFACPSVSEGDADTCTILHQRGV